MSNAVNKHAVRGRRPAPRRSVVKKGPTDGRFSACSLQRTERFCAWRRRVCVFTVRTNGSEPTQRSVKGEVKLFGPVLLLAAFVRSRTAFATGDGWESSSGLNVEDRRFGPSSGSVCVLAFPAPDGHVFSCFCSPKQMKIINPESNLRSGTWPRWRRRLLQQPVLLDPLQNPAGPSRSDR